MTVIDASASLYSFNPLLPSTGSDLSVATILDTGAESATRFAWITPHGHRIDVWGSFAGTGGGATGTVTRITIDFGNDAHADITIDALTPGPIALATLRAGHDAFWRAVTQGATELRGPSEAQGYWSGDALERGATDQAADDVMTGTTVGVAARWYGDHNHMTAATGPGRVTTP